MMHIHILRVIFGAVIFAAFIAIASVVFVSFYFLLSNLIEVAVTLFFFVLFYYIGYITEGGK